MPYDSLAALPDYVQKKSETKQRQWMAVFNSSYAACMKDGGDQAKCESGAFARANGVVKGGEMDDLHQAHHEGMAAIQLEKADSRVNFKGASSEADKTCGNCRFFDAMCLKCDLVEGTIGPGCYCDLWTEQMAGVPAGPMAMPTPEEPGYDYNEHPFRLFMDASAMFSKGDFAGADWYPYLPKPGLYEHPTYGQINITPEFNQLLVDSVKNHVYQEQIPLDAEHETKLSGAVGWLKDLRMNSDGSADAFIEWTDRGKALLGGGQFKYISPEWFSAWRDPASGVIYRNVVAGGAITTRPFFKEKVLRALVASEQVTEVIPATSDDLIPADRSKKSMADPKDEPKTYSAVEVDEKIKAAQEATEKTFAERLTAQTAELEAAKTLAASEKDAREALAAELTTLKNADRARRFADLVSGHGGSGDGAPWAGDQAAHVSMLEKLADQFTEQGEVFTAYVQQQAAIAAQLKQSGLFREFGTAASAGDQTPEDKLEALTQARMKADPSLSHAKAYAEVMSTPEGAKLYQG